ncbi:ATP-binding protein [Mucilaginibacter sp. RB4R14]|uniref:PAS domain-containing sensor histidine kinase n=1 Tax=Mucilaginibacter aurantiaciroseus TaxID=2949308 RepID=UPI00209183F8|nr:PAS domain-containing sensor histidine kinase [Mucilaginibacter aurantiaciroseus]MCO5935484.1 ATP-binding protein [Mucilaginibacter aurantiaciroseus]
MDKINEQNAFPKSIPKAEMYKPFQSLDITGIALESTNIGIWIIDITTRVFLPSPCAKELFGCATDKEMSFDGAMHQIPERYRPEVIATIENAFTKRKSFSIVFPIADGDTKQRWLSILGGCNNTEDDNCYFSGVVMDITEQKHNDLRKSKFIGMVSHELKTPLTVLKAYIQMLNTWAKKQKDHFTIGALSKAGRQVKRMLNMINGLLNLSGAEAGKIHLNKQDFLINDLINEVIEETQFITASDNTVLVPCETIQVHADQDKIEQVLINLLSNAAKYSSKDSLIEISCHKVDDKVQISIKDLGMGISPENIEKLFDPNYRVESKETEKISGFGIGLYLCSEIIKRHQGKIWVESELGKGSIFFFTLPLN